MSAIGKAVMDVQQSEMSGVSAGDESDRELSLKRRKWLLCELLVLPSGEVRFTESDPLAGWLLNEPVDVREESENGAYQVCCYADVEEDEIREGTSLELSERSRLALKKRLSSKGDVTYRQRDGDRHTEHTRRRAMLNLARLAGLAHTIKESGFKFGIVVSNHHRRKKELRKAAQHELGLTRSAAAAWVEGVRPCVWTQRSREEVQRIIAQLRLVVGAENVFAGEVVDDGILLAPNWPYSTAQQVLLEVSPHLGSKLEDDGQTDLLGDDSLDRSGECHSPV